MLCIAHRTIVERTHLEVSWCSMAWYDKLASIIAMFSVAFNKTVKTTVKLVPGAHMGATQAALLRVLLRVLVSPSC